MRRLATDGLPEIVSGDCRPIAVASAGYLPLGLCVPRSAGSDGYLILPTVPVGPGPGRPARFIRRGFQPGEGRDRLGREDDEIMAILMAFVEIRQWEN